jgi:hypothetical protein
MIYVHNTGLEKKRRKRGETVHSHKTEVLACTIVSLGGAIVSLSHVCKFVLLPMF